MSFYYAQNLVEKSVTAGNPWDFVVTENITEQIRQDKDSRQEFYRNVNTQHCFYTALEGVNPNQRVSKDNPPRLLSGFTGDYDIKIPKERVTEAIAAMKIKPAYIEESLGRNPRLIWTFERPLMIDDYDFCVFILQRAKKFLRLDLLPGLDEGAFETPTRLLCNGGKWELTGHGNVPEKDLQAFFVDCGQAFRFNSEAKIDVPLEVVEKALREKFPAMDWPGDFILGSQGPTFWVPNSTSPMSAIVKPDGMFTFSNSAEKPFYSWSDILGPDFLKDYSTDAIARSTTDIWWDEKNFWMRKKGVYVPLQKDELTNYFEIDCGMPVETSKGKKSMVKIALAHIFRENFVHNAAPYVFRPSGLIEYQGKRRLNTYNHRLIEPAGEKSEWGEFGKFPFLSLVLDNLLDPPEQLPRLLAWYKYYYNSGLTLNPMPGQMVLLMGGVGVGKTLTNREIFGRGVGGFVDASDFVIKGKEFNWHLFEVPHWCIDDDTISDSASAHAHVQAVFKKLVANKDFVCNQKFRNAGMTEWMGRILCTTNLDFVSTRIVGSLDNGTLDKISMFKCAKFSRTKFPERGALIKIIATELPYFLRWLVEWEPPDFVTRDTRFGFASYQEPSLMEQAHQTSRIAPFKELLIEALLIYFTDKRDVTEWKGTVTQLQRLISMNPLNDCVLRSLKLDQINRYLENVQREGVLPCVVEPGPMKTRVWVFKRFTPDNPEPISEQITSSQNAINIFSK